MSPRSTSRIRTAVSTVSMAVPVKRSRVGAAALSFDISKETSNRLLRGSNLDATICMAPE